MATLEEAREQARLIDVATARLAEQTRIDPHGTMHVPVAALAAVIHEMERLDAALDVEISNVGAEVMERARIKGAIRAAVANLRHIRPAFARGAMSALLPLYDDAIRVLIDALGDERDRSRR